MSGQWSDPVQVLKFCYLSFHSVFILFRSQSLFLLEHSMKNILMKHVVVLRYPKCLEECLYSDIQCLFNSKHDLTEKLFCQKIKRISDFLKHLLQSFLLHLLNFDSRGISSTCESLYLFSSVKFYLLRVQHSLLRVFPKQD